MLYTNKQLSRQKTIIWFLMAALFVQVLLPLQVHMHHDETVVHHDNDHHIIDYHNGVIGDIDHSMEEFIHTIELTSDFLVKKLTDNTLKVFLLFSFVIVISLTTISYRQRRYGSVPLLYRNHFALSPPLRAPPR